MAMVPHERSLVKQFAGKPFALIGVDVDADRETLQKTQEKTGMTWRSFFDGAEGPICKDWDITVLPTIYVLDASGKIRYKEVHGKEMDQAVDKLLKELEGKR